LALAQVHSQNNKRNDAIGMLERGLAKVRKDQQYELRWSLANLLLDDNRLEAAQKVIAEIREVNGLSADYLEARRDMARGRWFEAAKQLERIRPALKGAKELAFQTDLFLGACYEALEEPALQLTALQRAAEADASSLAARRGMANACWALGQTDEALRIYQELVLRTRDENEAAQRRIEFVRLLLQSGQHRNPKEQRRIDEELTNVEKTLPKALDVPLLRAELLFVQGDKQKAETLLQEAVKDHPHRYEPWLMLISFAANQKDAKRVAELMRKAEERFKDKAEFRLAQVRFWASRNDAAAGAAMLDIEREAGKFTPREQSILLQALAEAHFDAHRYADSERALTRVVQLPLHDQDMRVRMQLFELAIVQGDDAKARAAVAQIKRVEGEGGVDGSFAEALRIIRLERKASRELHEKARHLLTVAAAQRPNWHPIVQARAELDELQGRPDQAIANYRKAIDLGSRDPLATKQLLVLLSQTHRFHEVEQLLARMHKQHGPTDELVRYYVVHSYNRNDLKKAEYLIKQIVASNSTNYRDHLWMGQILSAAGNAPEDAEKALRRAIQLAPEQPETWLNLVRHLVGSAQLDRAKAEIDQAAKALPAGQRDQALAQCCELVGNVAQAAKHFEEALTTSSAPAQAHKAAADFCVRRDRPAAAEALYRKICERQVPASDQDVAAARRSLALTLARQNPALKSAEALRLVGLALDDKGLLPDGKIAEALEDQLLQAKVLGTLNHHRLRGKAIALMEAMHQKGVLSAEDQYFLARMLAHHGNDTATWQKTRNLLKALMQQEPRNSRFLSYAAHLHLQQKEFTEAEAIIAKLESVERERKVAAGAFGSIELRAKMLELRGLGAQATAMLRDYANQPDALPIRLLLVAHMEGRLGNFRSAIDLCEEVRAAPVYVNDANAAAIGILSANKPSEALLTQHAQWQEQRQRVEAGLREAIAKNAKDVQARLYLAHVMELVGKHNEVEKLCREVIREAPNNLVALNNLSWQLGQHAKTAAEALPLIERAIEHHGPRPELLDTRAVAHMNLGKFDLALRDLERVANEAPTPTRLFHLARAQEKTKNIPSAQATLREANAKGLTMQQLHPAEHAEFQRVTIELAKSRLQ
jgi:tetratricopeptide (TPR) repeat protein